jgi:pimeloyl-ACP methyl ester carboxylesterase
MQTGRSCWAEVAAGLAKDYLVIVPDCRGHGQSSNPGHSYSFKELAADTVGLVSALGYERAHLIGHSNGGNVVLVALLEHPEVVQTCIPMAANAWVSPDLLEKEPAIFDPERVAREAPEWKTEMILLHSPTHGPDYWRELLELTVAEIIKEPNYTPADLQKVQKPVLVIQGEKDRVNAPYRHAQFIARHIPYAQRWIPEAVDHSVHQERLSDWVEKVLAFLSRRGSDANELLYRYQQDHYPDSRLQPFDVRVERNALTGLVLDENMHQAARQALPAPPERDELRVLVTPQTPWLLVNRSVDDLRREPSILSELVSQARLGEAGRLLEQQEKWSYIRLEHDGYMGWTHTNGLYICTEAEVQAYLKVCTHQVAVGLGGAYAGLEDQQLAGLVPFCVRLPLIERKNGRAAVKLPDGRVWWLAENNLQSIPERPYTSPEQIQAALELIRNFVGTPYQWGGRTPFGYDCSGLAGSFWAFLGIQLLRDADQQFRSLPLAEGTLQAGDLLFFGSLDEDETDPLKARITHVAIALDEHSFIHSNGAQWGIGYNSFDPTSPIFSQSLKDSFRGARRPR